MAAWVEEDAVVIGLCDPDLDELLLTNERNHGWDMEQYLSEGLITGFEESERMTSEEYRKMFARARLELPCAAPEMCVLFAVNAFWAMLSGRVATVSTVLVSQKGSECRSCVVVPNTIYFAFIGENCPVSQCHVLKWWICAKRLENCT